MLIIQKVKEGVGMKRFTSLVLIAMMVIGGLGAMLVWEGNEEAAGEISYDPITNTIYVNQDADLIFIDSEIDDSIFWREPLTTIFHTNAHIQINDSVTLNIGFGQSLKFNDTGPLLPLYVYVYGILNADGLSVSNIEFSSNSSTPSPGDWGGIQFLSAEASSSVLDYVNIYNATQAIYCEISNPSITNSDIAGNSENGLHLIGSSPTVSRCNIYDNGDILPSSSSGIYFQSSSPTIVNTTLSNPIRDMMLIDNSDVVTLDSTFNDNNVLITDLTCSLTVKWYLEINVQDEDDQSPIPDANVRITSIGTVGYDESSTTAQDGSVQWIQIIDYIEDSSSKTTYNPYNITVTAPRYLTGYAHPEPYIEAGENQSILINLSLLDIDLGVVANEITFTNDQPIAGEQIHIDAIIHNYGEDSTSGTDELVKVSFYDNDTTHQNEMELTPAIYVEYVEGNSYVEVSRKWTATPGEHIIRVWADPDDKINETEELNNYAERYIFVNALPEVNITKPQEQEEVKNETFINGTAFDSVDDGGVNNNITGIELSLDDLDDWIPVDPVNIVPNDQGGFNWSYEWNTTRWNDTDIADGNHAIKARAWDGNRTTMSIYMASEIEIVNVTVNNTIPNRPPVANISLPLESEAFDANETIEFNASGSFDPDGDTLQYFWDFGDDTNSSWVGTLTVTHHYTLKKSYLVTLNVSDGNLYNLSQVSIEIDNYPPVANITVSNHTVRVNSSIKFKGTGSEDTDGTITEYFWEFGDGNTSDLQEPEHTYNITGTFQANLTVTDDDFSTNTTFIIITIYPNSPPDPVIDDPSYPNAFDVNETIIFNSTSSSDPDGDNIDYFWDFGDGTNSSWIPDPITTHHYSDYGPNIFPEPLLSYTVTLYVRDQWGLTSSDFVYIIVNNFPPVSIVKANKTYAQTYSNITFWGNESYDNDQGIQTYEWDFDDGNTSNAEIVEHQFSQDGVYNVTLTVTDLFGANDTDWIITTITNRNPVIINASGEPEETIILEVIWFNVTASDDDGLIVNYSWDFDDGTTYYETENYHFDGAFDGRTTHSYSAKGAYTVTVTVEDDDGGITPREIPILIINSPPDVNITSHEDGDTVENTVKIEGTAEDIDGDSILGVEIKIGNGDWEPAEDTSGNDDWSTWSYDWDTSPPETKNSPHTVYVRANDSFDLTDPLFSITLTVDNDPTGITITMTLSETSVEAGETVTVSGKAEFDTGEPVQDTKVTVSILGGQMWNTTTDPDGLYSQDIIAPSEEETYTVKVAITKGSVTGQNTDTLTVTAAAGKPDLTLSENDIVFDITSPKTGDTVKIQATIHNTGTLDATGVLVSFYDGDPDSGDFIASYSVDVSASSSSVASVDWEITSFVSLGTHTIWIVIDRNDLITEEDDENNNASKTIDIAGLPDLVISSENIHFSNDNPLEGDTITIRITIENTGSSSATVDCDIYDGDPDSGGVLITQKRVTVAAVDHYILDMDWTPEKAGQHDIYVVIDEDGDVDELSVDNNKAHQVIDVEGKEEAEPQNWVLIIFVIIVILAVIVLIYLNRIGKFGPSPRKDEEIPTAEVVSKKSKKKPPKKEEKAEESSLGGHGGIRLG